jgi:DAK2 domain fusion protein YloV
MTTLQRLGAVDLKAVVVGYRDALRSHQEAINRLNVYPVPDGDTGTNMALTLESVVAELDGTADMPSVCKAISHGSLMGARGNSGVILSQILRGIAKGFEESEAGDGAQVADALLAASAGAYQAVQRPVEGTILSVCKAAAEAANAARASDLIAVLDAAHDAAKMALAYTPEQLPALKQAGVVDAGGAGFTLLIDAFLLVSDGRPLPIPPVVSGPALISIEQAHDSVSDLRYEVMYFLEAPDDTVPAFREVWAGIGDSIVVVGGDGIWNCHIHTDDIGSAIEAALDVGRPRQIRVTDLEEQVEEERWVREAPADLDLTDAVPVTTAVVAVATGAGVARLFRSVGVQAVVAGGQSMNPSTAQLVAAVEACPSDAVVILPNNSNIIPVAEQVPAMTGKTITVVRTRSLTEGLAAAFAYDPEGTIDANQMAMDGAVASVVTGEITVAVRDAVTDAGPVREGEYLGISRDGIAVVAPAIGDACTALIAHLITEDHEIVTVLEGEGASAAATRHITQWMSDAYPSVMVEVHHGGQPVYPYLFSIE